MLFTDQLVRSKATCSFKLIIKKPFCCVLLDYQPLHRSMVYNVHVTVPFIVCIICIYWHNVFLWVQYGSVMFYAALTSARI